MTHLRPQMARALLAMACGIFAAVPASHAQDAAKDYPARPIRFIVAQTAGGPTDLVARTISDRLGKSLGQPIIVENRPGAGSTIATNAVAHSAPDGYTILVATVQHIINPYLFVKLPYDSVKDFAPITVAAQAQLLFLCGSQVPVHDLKELVEYARKNPGKISWAHSGVGGTGHLAVELLQLETGIDVVKVPYKGTQPAMSDVLGGQVQCMSAATSSALPFIKSGKLRPLAIAGPKRSNLLPEVKTVGEQGFPRSEAPGPLALLAPAHTPAAIIDKLQSNITAIVRSQDVEDLLAAQGMESVGNTPAQFADYIQQEGQRLGDVIRKAGIKAE
ncbi:MAG: tripartite tricarboxylate transporter substrate binding protein [Ottowia sp.]|uniref:Bug family tripartite tricarboxylate transporter substrate binding protein n=1 Tax=Ottowia sp. TaxID=1898956 RepID=UPI003C712D70